MAAFETLSEGNIEILTISGRLEPNSWKDLKDVITALMLDANTHDLIIDLHDMEYVASAGFREFFIAGRTLSRQGRKLAVCGLRGEVKRIFDIAKFDTAYPTFEDRTAALHYLQNS